ncbi:MAG: alpha/beta fold hydrolase [Hyphomonas sp.]|uniref:alpha/beta fold hydrolase n=1 Tax=Hyphomonas sp. TaxID=87 RepID=UPI0034A0564A
MAIQDVLFLPGFMCDERLFAPQTQSLTAAGYRCRMGDYGSSASIDRMAREAMRNSPGRVALVGLSMGAVVALEIWRQFPERVTHLALLNTTARADASGPARKSQLRRVVAGELSDVLRAELAPKYFACAHRSAAHLGLVEAMGSRLGPEAFVRQIVALMVRTSQMEMLHTVSCPVLVLGGDEDEVCPLSRQEEIAAAIPGAELCVLSPCGHISTLEQPGQVNAALLRLLPQQAARAPVVRPLNTPHQLPQRATERNPW